MNLLYIFEQVAYLILLLNIDHNIICLIMTLISLHLHCAHVYHEITGQVYQIFT